MLLAHGAGAATTSPFLTALTLHIAARGIAVWHVDFAYMRAAHEGGRRRPPPRIAVLAAEYADALESLRASLPERARLIVGGKSMGGRVATLIADDAWKAGKIAGAVVLGYPFHPPKKPETLRVAHLMTLAAPTLVIQGARDPFGCRSEIEGLQLSSQITLDWIENGDHDLGWRPGPAKGKADILSLVADRIAAFVEAL